MDETNRFFSIVTESFELIVERKSNIEVCSENLFISYRKPYTTYSKQLSEH